MTVVYRVGVSLLGATLVAGCASRQGFHQPGAPATSSAGSAAIMPAPGVAGAPATAAAEPGVWGATTAAVGGAASAVKNGASKMVAWVTPESKPTPAPDSISLASKSGKSSVELHIAMADMQERAGKIDQAQKHYEDALKQSPKNLDALLGLAHLYDRQGKFKEATEKYQTAARHHPKDARVWNDLGLCYARQKKSSEAVAALNKAIELQPAKALYRNNIATVLTETGKRDEALKHLTAVHGPAVANYNLGYLLYQKGNKGAAAEHFAQASAADPNFVAARQWTQQLGATASAPIASPNAGPAQPQVAVSDAGARLRQSYIAEPRAGEGEPYYRNQLRQAAEAPYVAGAAYTGAPVSGAANNSGVIAPSFTQSRIATAPRPLPPIDSNEGPPVRQ